jgi:hypothetical protein
MGNSVSEPSPHLICTDDVGTVLRADVLGETSQNSMAAELRLVIESNQTMISEGLMDQLP